MKLGCVAQRYGLNIAGGAELHCRLVAEHLARRHTVEVFTTCAADYVSWKNEFRPGQEIINGVTVHRFRVAKGRNIRTFENVQNMVFHEKQSRELEERWFRENGPFSPDLVRAVQKRTDIDVWILFSYRYWTTVQTLRIHRHKALLVPTAEHDPALYMDIVRELFQLPAAIVYNSVEECELIRTVSNNHGIHGEIVGVGLPEQAHVDSVEPNPDEKYAVMDPYIVYIGRIDKNKGCDHLFRLFRRFYEEVRQDVQLLLIGSSVIPIPDHPGIHRLGFVSESEKTSVLQHSRMLVMPSQYESLSMVVLEAWRQSKPVLANARCEVLNGQCLRSNGGLVYRNYDEFATCLEYLLNNPDVSATLGRQGQAYYRSHYEWPIIEEKYARLMKHVLETNMKE